MPLKKLIRKLLSPKKDTDTIPEDILLRLKKEHQDERSFNQAVAIIEYIKQDKLNVGWVQLSRAIILLSDGSTSKMQEIVDSGYFGDPRDVIAQLMELPGNTNDHGLTPFDTD